MSSENRVESLKNRLSDVKERISGLEDRAFKYHRGKKKRKRRKPCSESMEYHQMAKYIQRKNS